MNVYTCKDFQGHWPVGCSAVVVAQSVDRAAELLEQALARCGLHQSVKPHQMLILERHFEHAVILQDGDY